MALQLRLSQYPDLYQDNMATSSSRVGSPAPSVRSRTITEGSSCSRYLDLSEWPEQEAEAVQQQMPQQIARAWSEIRESGRRARAFYESGRSPTPSVAGSLNRNGIHDIVEDLLDSIEDRGAAQEGWMLLHERSWSPSEREEDVPSPKSHRTRKEKGELQPIRRSERIARRSLTMSSIDEVDDDEPIEPTTAGSSSSPSKARTTAKIPTPVSPIKQTTGTARSSKSPTKKRR
ncbi:uncharacterized protein FIBRA_01913 [Fibroporia radiculosa]|uniref:Uncharacterized protein n=1 Tax=Fibroporia radiculosa TaxID=599839 RepID=J4G190_9APHY|nr:uncharacterized protein FIBRA_01913 [Fibroporia radiculosa]CCL99888.1 predicted protein [Fibroporia radiculosa]